MDLHFDESGNKDGPLLVFLHGGGLSSWMWKKQMCHFSQYHCLAPDLPGHGLSSDMTFSITDSAEKITAFINQKSTGKKVILIGLSLGAQIALQILSNVSNSVNYAVINSALTRPVPFVSNWINPSVKLTYGLTKLRWFSKLQAKQLYISTEDFETYYNESRLMKSTTLIRILEESLTFSLPPDITHSKAKILVTVGSKEKRMMIKSARDIVKRYPHSKGVIVPGVGHGFPLANSTLFNDTIEAWINNKDVSQELRSL
jgi:pimeloyl-ACP methyl ester carboxylesterase